MNGFTREITIDGANGILGGLLGGGVLALSLAMVLVALACAFSWYIIRAIGYWRAFQKAGEAGWKAVIPFYNTYTRYKLTWNTKMFWISLALMAAEGILPESGEGLASFVRLVVSVGLLVIFVKGAHKTSLAFGHGSGFAVGLFFLEPVFALILGFDRSGYEGIPQ